MTINEYYDQIKQVEQIIIECKKSIDAASDQLYELQLQVARQREQRDINSERLLFFEHKLKELKIELEKKLYDMPLMEVQND